MHEVPQWGICLTYNVSTMQVHISIVDVDWPHPFNACWLWFWLWLTPPFQGMLIVILIVIGIGKGRYTFPFQFACPIQFAFRSIRHPPSTHSIRITAFPITLSVCPPHTTSHGGPLKPPDTAQGPGCHTGYQQNEPENTSCLRAWLHDTMTTRYKMRLPIRGYTLRLAYTISEVSKSVSESVS